MCCLRCPPGSETSTTQAVHLEITGQSNSRFPLEDRNGDALHEDDLTAGSVFKAVSDASSWDILILPDEGGTTVTANPSGTDGEDLTRLAVDGTNFNLSSGISWGFQIDTLIVPELNQDAISDARIVLEDSGLTHYLTFLDWTASDLDRIDHLPVGAHIGLRQGTTTRLLDVEAEWDSTNDRYQVSNVNTGILTEASSGTATELLLTAGGGGGSDLAAQEEGTEVESAATTFNFTGDGVTATGSSGTVTVNIPGGSGGSGSGVSIGDAIGTYRLVNSYTTNRMYASTVPTPAADDGDLMVITFAPDATSPDNAIGGSEVAFVPIANLLAIPNAYTGSGTADSEGSNRDSLRTGFGQNDWLYLGGTVAGAGNITIGSTDAKYAGVFTFRILTYGTAGGSGGEESPRQRGRSRTDAGPCDRDPLQVGSHHGREA